MVRSETTLAKAFFVGGCYIETKNLDGETNLKPKKVDNTLSEYFPDEKDV